MPELLIIKYRSAEIKGFFLLLLAICYCTPDLNAQTVLSKKITLNIESNSIEEILKHLQDTEGISFSYSKSIINLDQKISVHAVNKSLEEILNQVFSQAGIIYRLKAGIIILQPKPQNIDKLIIRGSVMCMDKNVPLEYAGVQVLKEKSILLTDAKGNFSIQIRKESLQDSLVISCLGYEESVFAVSGFAQHSEHTVYLRPRMMKLEVVEVKASDFRIYSLGNHKLISFGSIYIDTQGQQTAMFIENKKKKKGIISSVSYYLSDKGNTGSPFRVRIYEIDSLSQKPGRDLLNEIVVAKPDFDGGWFKVDISGLQVEVPLQGFFVAIEGIYLGEYNEKIDEFKDISDGLEEEVPNTISYGQRLGYSKRNSHDTWHYSLAHKWFQLKEDNYHVMISAEIQVKKHRKKKKEKEESGEEISENQ